MSGFKRSQLGWLPFIMNGNGEYTVYPLCHPLSGYFGSTWLPSVWWQHAACVKLLSLLAEGFLALCNDYERWEKLPNSVSRFRCVCVRLRDRECFLDYQFGRCLRSVPGLPDLLWWLEARFGFVCFTRGWIPALISFLNCIIRLLPEAVMFNRCNYFPLSVSDSWLEQWLSWWWKKPTRDQKFFRSFSFGSPCSWCPWMRHLT